MTTVLLGGVITTAIILLILVGLQGAKSETASSAIMGGYQDTKLFAETKERGIDLFLTRATAFFGFLFFLCIILYWVL